MSRAKIFTELPSLDPRERTAKDYDVGDRLQGSRVEAIRHERKGGKAGLRIVLRDGRRAWMRPGTKVYDANFTRP